MSLIVSYIKPKPLTFFRHQHYLNKKKTKTLIGLKKKKKNEEKRRRDSRIYITIGIQHKR